TLIFPILLSACSSSDQDDTSQISTLLPDAQKKVLVDTGIAFANQINPADHQEFIETMQTLADLMESYPLEEAGNQRFAAFARSIARVVKRNNPNALPEVGRAISEVVSIDEYLGVYRFDASRKVWVFTAGGDNLQAIFLANGKEAQIVVTPSKDFVPVEVEGDEVHIPVRIETTITRGGNPVASLHNAVELTDANATEAIRFKIGGYVWQADLYMSATQARGVFDMNKDNALLLSANAHVAGTNLGDIFEGNATENNFAEAKASCSVMNTIQLDSECSNVGLLIRKTDKIEDDYQNGTDFTTEAEKKYATDMANCINEYVTSRLFTENKAAADVLMQPYVEVEEYYGNRYEYWDYEPVLLFYSDQSKHSLEDFFNENDFGKVIDDFKALYDRYQIYFK
ncbi:MAG: hypothetical protein RR837_12665, partial [Bacteroidales bacterium]